ncbi:VOC family protein [Mobilicoccus massiliensis]|uniref:VOC family protein n=1 Tax=Mobilicoccus massiliensis TaxID=1522310 RepID=UPI00058D73D4|nr:VOC family protein [Mobilicoccus massiliensis]
MVRFQNPVLGVDDLDRAIAFWSAFLDYRPIDAGRTARWCTLVPADGDGLRVGLMHSTTPARDRPRVHLDFAVDSAEAQEDAARRACELGGERVDWPDYPDDADFVVLADTEGNRFCVVRPR